MKLRLLERARRAAQEIAAGVGGSPDAGETTRAERAPSGHQTPAPAANYIVWAYYPGRKKFEYPPASWTVAADSVRVALGSGATWIEIGTAWEFGPERAA